MKKLIPCHPEEHKVCLERFKVWGAIKHPIKFLEKPNYFLEVNLAFTAEPKLTTACAALPK